MSQQQPRSLDEIIEHAKQELTEHAEHEQRRITAEADAAIARIRGAEDAVGAEPARRSPRRFERGVEPDPAKDVPAGAVLMARRLADEGHTREEVTEFLAENFRRIDVPAAVDHAFHDVHATH